MMDRQSTSTLSYQKYQNHRTLILAKNLPTSPTYRSKTHQLLLSQVAQEAHIILGVLNKGHPVDWMTSQTHAIATLWLHKPWNHKQRWLDKPLYLEEPMTPPMPRFTRTPLTLETLSTLLWDDYPEATQKAQEAQEG
jgi:hypothetical protein